MADLTPTTDKKGPPKKTIIILGVAGGALLLYFWYKKKKEAESAPTQQNPYLAQSFIPVTAENVGGVGAGGGGTIGGGIGNTENENLILQAQKENTLFLTEYLKNEREGRKEEQNRLFEFLREHPITGGGTPSEPPKYEPKPVPPPPVPPPPIPPPPPPPVTGGAKCPSSYPNWNPLNGPPSPHSCWRYSREKCGPKNSCPIHGYQDGHEVCVC